MTFAKQTFYAACALVIVSMSSGLGLAQPPGIAPSSGQESTVADFNGLPVVLAVVPGVGSFGEPNPMFRLIKKKGACKREASPCKSDKECCSGFCAKGTDEGRPGAWCTPR